MKGTKKDCGLFVDRLKVNREQAEINNKKGRTRKKTTKLLDYAADPVEEVNSSPAKITQRVRANLSPREETSDSEGKHGIIRRRKELTGQKQDKSFPAGAQKSPIASDHLCQSLTRRNHLAAKQKLRLPSIASAEW